jgi:hypothetical protein
MKLVCGSICHCLIVTERWWRTRVSKVGQIKVLNAMFLTLKNANATMRRTLGRNHEQLIGPMRR